MFLAKRGIPRKAASPRAPALAENIPAIAGNYIGKRPEGASKQVAEHAALRQLSHGDWNILMHNCNLILIWQPQAVQPKRYWAMGRLSPECDL